MRSKEKLIVLILSKVPHEASYGLRMNYVFCGALPGVILASTL